MIRRPAVKWMLALLMLVVAAGLLWVGGTKVQAGGPQKPMSKINPKTLQITITNCTSDATDVVHAPKKSEGGLVVFSGDADYTIQFQSPDFWQGSPNGVSVRKDIGAALFADSDGGKSTHFCMQGTSCSEQTQCPPADWPRANPTKKGKRGTGDPNDIVVP